MSPDLLKFTANFFSIIVFALAVDSQKVCLASSLMGEVEEFDETDLESATKGIHMMNTMSLTFVSAINAYACFSERSSRHLTLVGLAYLLNFLLFGLMIRWKQARKEKETDSF